MDSLHNQTKPPIKRASVRNLTVVTQKTGNEEEKQMPE